MAIEAQILEDMKAAMKSGDTIRLETIRMLRAQLKNANLGKKDPLAEDDVMSIIAKEAKKRKESIALYEKGGRQDLVENEKQELEILQSYLPKALTVEEIDVLIGEAISRTNASGTQDMGKVMGIIMPQVKSRADGKLIQERVRLKLS
ncbi:GatB/YqeY domain-containing protein [bacterium]|nr:GatB/YqeY domain-containing protein [bacterium]